MNIVQLYGTDQSEQGLFSFDPAKMSEDDAVQAIEQAFENAYLKDEEAGCEEDFDIFDEAQAELKKQGIERVFAAIANTERL